MISGIPAARSEPSVKNSTTSAMITPMPSVRLKPGVVVGVRLPADRGRGPGDGVLQGDGLGLEPVQRRVLDVPGSSWTLMIAAWSSSEMVPSTSLSNGDVAVSTPSTRSYALTASSISVRTPLSRTDWPSGTTTTTWAEVPLTCGNVTPEGVERGLRLGAGQREALVELPADGERETPEQHQRGDPGSEHAPPVAERSSAEAVEERGHAGSLAKSGQAITPVRRTPVRHRQTPPDDHRTASAHVRNCIRYTSVSKGCAT